MKRLSKKYFIRLQHTSASAFKPHPFGEPGAFGSIARSSGYVDAVRESTDLLPEFFPNDTEYVDTSITYPEFKKMILDLEHSEKSIIAKCSEAEKLLASMLDRNIPPLFTHVKPIMHMVAATGDVKRTFEIYYQTQEQFFHQLHAQYVSALCNSIIRSTLFDPRNIIVNIREYLLPWLKTVDLTKLEPGSVNSIVILFNTGSKL